MGYLGFLFNISEIARLDKKSFILSKSKDKKYFVIFIERPNFNFNVIIGNESFFKSEECSFFYLDKYRDFKEFLVFDNSKFRYAKFHLSKESIVDYYGFTFWFNSISYRKLREYFLIDERNSDFDSTLVEKTLNILNYF